MSEAELIAAYRDHFRKLCGYLMRIFPPLDSAACEDSVQMAFVQVLEKVRNSGLKPETKCLPYLYKVVRNRAIDEIRKRERNLFVEFSARTTESSDAKSSDADRQPPSKVLVRAERRRQQGKLLSQILQEFCRRCEARPEMLKQKEVFERNARGQEPAEIAKAMGIPQGNVYVHLSRAREWVRERVRKSDVHRSVFLTFHRQYPEA